MMILITGGSKCGKSAAAEAILDGFEEISSILPRWNLLAMKRKKLLNDTE